MLNNNQKKSLIIADILLIAVAAIWGSSYGVAKYSLQFYSVLGFLTIRFGLTTALLLPFLLKDYKKDAQAIKTGFIVGVPLGLILLAIFLCETYGVFYTSASNAAFLISLCIIITPFLEWLLLKNRPNNIVFLCAGLSLFGIYLLTMQTALTLQQGDVFIICAALLRGLMVVFTKKRLANHQVSSLHLTTVQVLVVFVGCLIFLFSHNSYYNIAFTLPTNLMFWFASLYLVVFCTIIAFFVQNWAIKIGSPSRASILMGSEPVFGALFAVWLFGESLTVSAWLGGILITLSSIILVLGTTKNSSL